MNTTYVLDIPLQRVKTQTIAKYQIQQVVVHLFTGCTIYLGLFDSDSKPVEDIMLKMEQADYDRWNSDDSYIVSWINAQLESRCQTN